MPEAHQDKAQELQAKYDRLNRQFYTAEPHEYFAQRWQSLVSLSGRADELADLLRGSSQDQHVGTEALAPADAEQADDYVAVESEVLLHQTSETLLRLFLAHWGTSGCPWLDIAAERTPAQFKHRVETQILGASRPALREAAHWVCLAAADRPALIAEESWGAALDSLASFLRTFAGRWLGDAPLYNSLKHGLSVVPGAAEIAFASEPDLSDAYSFGHGLSIDYLDFGKVIPKRRVWKKVTRWLDVNESLALTQVAFQMMESIWAVGRARFTDGPAPTRCFVPVGLTPFSFRSPNRAAAHQVTVPLYVEEQL